MKKQKHILLSAFCSKNNLKMRKIKEQTSEKVQNKKEYNKYYNISK